MNSAETARLLLFVGVIVFIFVRAIAAAFSYVRGRHPLTWHAIIFMALAGLGVICMAYGYLVEPNWVDVTRVTVPIQGVSVWFAGLAYGNETKLSQTLNTIPAGSFITLLYHTPDLIEEVARESVDLYCAGHTHGGQVALPLYGAMLTLSKFDKKYEAGLYRERNTLLYVNRGIGMEGGSVPRVRFWSRPEVTVIDVVAESR